MSLIKVSTYSFVTTGAKILSGLVINKAVAIYIGPSGLATIGQFQNFLTAVVTGAQGAFIQGVVKYSAEYPLADKQFSELVGTAIRIAGLASIVLGFLIFLFSHYLSVKLIGSPEYSLVLQILSFALIVIVYNSLLLSILNGLQLYKYYFGISLVQSLVGLVVTALLIVKYGLKGALLALVLNQSVVFLIALWLLRQSALFRVIVSIPKFSSAMAKKLGAFSLMGLTSAIMAPLSHIYIRQKIGTDLGWDSAGQWQAIWYISSIYLMVITTSMGTYYLPKLSTLQTVDEIRQEVKAAYRVVMPLVLLSAAVIFAMKEVIVSLLFTQGFTPMLPLFQWQLLGDVVKMAAWLLSYLMLAKAHAKTFIFTEVAFTVSLVFLTYLCLGTFGIQGACIAYLLNYIIYFSVMVAWYRGWGAI